MESPPPEKQTVRVTILNRQYTLRAAGDPSDIERAAAQLDDLLLALAAKAPNADSTHIAVLACLHLADKLTALDREMESLRQSVDQKSEKCRGMIEELIASVEAGV
ncbi:MAG: cell division protein ZapA [Bryobacteraceae bacterium]|jgi:cell division protein ZapA